MEGSSVSLWCYGWNVSFVPHLPRKLFQALPMVSFSCHYGDLISVGSHILYTRTASQLLTSCLHLRPSGFPEDDSMGLCWVLTYAQTGCSHVLTPSGVKLYQWEMRNHGYILYFSHPIIISPYKLRNSMIEFYGDILKGCNNQLAAGSLLKYPIDSAS